MKWNTIVGVVWLHAALSAAVSSLFADEPPPGLPEPAETVNSDNIRSEREGVSTLEDGSVAEAIDRRPDLQFRNIKVDGEETILSLDDLSSDSVTSLEVLRAVTPEMDADARGGSLVVRSKPAYDLKSPASSLAVNTAYRSRLDNRRDSVYASHARSLGAWGFRVNASLENGLWGSTSYFSDWSKTSGGDLFNLSRAAIEANVEEATKYTFGGTTDWKLSEHFALYLRGNYSLKDSILISQPVLRYRWHAGSAPLPGEATGLVERDLTSYESDLEESSLTLGGFLDYERTSIDFRILANRQHRFEPDYLIIEFREPDADLTYRLDAEAFPILEAPSVHGNPQAFVFDELQTGTWEQSRKETIAAFNLRHATEFLGGEITLKLGGKWMARDFDQLSDELFFTGFDGDFRMSDVSGSPYNEPVIGGRYLLGPFPDDRSSRDFLSANLGAFKLNERLSREASDPRTYQVSETIPAAYGMVDWKRSRWRLLGGLRFEQTRLDFLAREVIADAEGEYVETNEIEGISEYDNLFPGVHLRYFLGSRTTIITSVTRTIQRHFYGQIAPYRYADFEDKTVREGNPSLRPTLYWNFDAAIDYKLDGDSLLALDLFHRAVSDTIFPDETLLEEGPFAGFRRNSLNNGPSASISGLKTTWKQTLEQWNASLEGLSFNLNGTFQKSETEYPRRQGEKLAVAGVPDLKFQVLLTLDRGRTYVQLNYSYVEGNLSSVSDRLWRDRFTERAEQLGIDFSFRLNESWRVLGELNNLRDQGQRVYLRDPKHLVESDQDPTWVKLGLRWEG